jgi:lysophospholipase L1-like esterase
MYGFDPRGFLGDRYGAEDRWVDLVARRTGRELINGGVNGRVIPRNPYALRLLREYEPVDIFLVMLGTNDLLQGSTASETAARMEHFLTQLQPHCPGLLLVAPPPMKRGAWVDSDTLVEESHRLIHEYRVLAQRMGISFVDTADWQIPMAFDGVHFTEEGHRLFASRLIKFIK